MRLRVEPKPDTHRGTIYSSAAVLLFALTCPALRAQQPAASAPGTGTGPQPANYSAKTLEAPGKPASPTSQADTLRQLNERLLEAHDVADVPTLDRIENDDFTLSGDFGTVTKQEHLDHVRKVGGQPQPVDREITPQQIRIYGDGAPITETDHASGSGGKSEYQTKSMWVRSGKNWRIVHMHYSKLAEKPGP